MISYAEALKLIRQESRLQKQVRSMRDEALGLICAEKITAGLSIPPFNNSAMDGFAVKAKDTENASHSLPITLPVSHRIAAGDVLDNTHAGAAIEIMTGADVPSVFDAVIPVEDVVCIKDTQGRTTSIQVHRPISPGANIRLAGEDFQPDSLIAEVGDRLHAGHIAAIAATGVNEISVFDMPTIKVFATGKEVIDAYDQPLKSGEIYNSNTPYLLSHLKAAGLPAQCAGNIGDSPEAFAEKLNDESASQILISTGAVSKGHWDFIPDVLRQAGARIVFHRVAIKPGKPILFAILKDGRYFFGLPGNPVASAVGLRFFVQPLIRRLLGMPDEVFPYARLDNSYVKNTNLCHFLKARVAQNLQGQSWLHILDGQESFKISPLLAMNCWGIIPETSHEFSIGDTIQIAPMDLFSSLI